jgi:hypothetical membrane protein
MYAGAAAVASSHVPGFSQLTNFISELGATGSPAAGIMNFGGFLPYGVLMAAFAVGLHRGIGEGPGGWLGPAVLGVYGLAYVALAFAPCDQGCQPVTPSIHHRLHFFLGDFIFLAMVVSAYALYSRLMKDRTWAALGGATLVLPAAAWLILNLSLLGIPGGLRQRICLLLIFLWIELMGLRLFRGARSAAR